MYLSDESIDRNVVAARWVAELHASGEPSPEQLEALEAWCQADGGNRLAYETVARLWSASQHHPPSAHDVASLLSSQRMPAMRLPRAVLCHWRGVAAMSVLALTVALFGLYRWPLSSRWRHSAQRVTLTSAPAHNSRFVLSDGTTVALGGDSSVQVRITPTERLLTVVSGEAYFHDTHAADWPFVVVAGGTRIIARGTSFDVERASHRTVVAVVDGVIDVDPRLPQASTAEAANLSETVELAAGQELLITPTGYLRRAAVGDGHTVGWLDGRLEFPSDDLADVIEQVNRYSGRPIRIADPKIAAIRFTGTIFLNSISQWVDSLPMVFPIEVEVSDREIVLKAR